MAELLLELYSEEIPPQLQITVRNQLKLIVESSLKDKSVKHKDIQVYSSPTRLTLFIKDLPCKIVIPAKETRGPKAGSPNNILEGFAKAKSVSKNDLYLKNIDKAQYYFAKTSAKNIDLYI